MVTIRHERPADDRAREALLDVAYGPSRFTKPSARLRDGRLPANGLSFVAVDGGRVVGTVRLWHVAAGPDRAALLLGPLAVHPDCRNRGIGSALVERALREARGLGHSAVLLVGDAPYYSRFGFSAAKTRDLALTGRYDQNRLLGAELLPGALDGARGYLRASGQRQGASATALPVASATGVRRPRLSRAA